MSACCALPGRLLHKVEQHRGGPVGMFDLRNVSAVRPHMNLGAGEGVFDLATEMVSDDRVLLTVDEQRRRLHELKASEEASLAVRLLQIHGSRRCKESSARSRTTPNAREVIDGRLDPDSVEQTGVREQRFNGLSHAGPGDEADGNT